jgi:prepilin-type N-terminal cleavage/methylation domain-containing protein
MLGRMLGSQSRPGVPEQDIMNVTRENGFTLIELMFVCGLIGVLTAIAAPALSRTRLAANEASAISSLRTISSGQQLFWSTCGNGYYAATLQGLGIGPVAGQQGFIAPELAGPVPVVKSGYEFDVTSVPADSSQLLVLPPACNSQDVVASYRATADPLPGMGRRFFGTNTGGGIFQSSQTLFLDLTDVGAPPAPAIPLQ